MTTTYSGDGRIDNNRIYAGSGYGLNNSVLAYAESGTLESFRIGQNFSDSGLVSGRLVFADNTSMLVVRHIVAVRDNDKTTSLEVSLKIAIFYGFFFSIFGIAMFVLEFNSALFRLVAQQPSHALVLCWEKLYKTVKVRLGHTKRLCRSQSLHRRHQSANSAQ